MLLSVQTGENETTDSIGADLTVSFLLPGSVTFGQREKKSEAVAVVLKTSLLRVEPRVHEVSTKQS